MIVTRQNYENWENQFLAPYAIRSQDSRGRKHHEKEHDLRTAFQRDRDRIVHSTAFRRLEYKTQVFVNHEGDHYRTRLTHTLETCQVARTMARALGLNEDLVEAIALAHDIGHGPFGHAGEWALQEIMKTHGGFEHNVQCLRIVEHLEESFPSFSGLNLTFETLEGLKKHPERFYRERKDHFRTLEAELVDIADEIAYNTHDLDDGLRSELIQENQLEDILLWRDALQYVKRTEPKITGNHRRRMAVRLIVNKLVKDVVNTSAQNIDRQKLKSLKDLQKTQQAVITYSKTMQTQIVQLKRFLHANLYQHYRVVRMTDKGQRILKEIFQVYYKKPAVLPPDILKRQKKDSLQRVICDYIAGMTDRFALDEYKRLFEPYERV